MNRAWWSWTWGLIVGATTLSGCASDDLTLPNAELTTPGAFIAVVGYEKENEMVLIRTIDRLQFEFETLLFFSTYEVIPANFDEAREMAKRHDLPLRRKIDAQPTVAITEFPWQVVWFRTLTEEEEAQVQ